MRTNVNWKLAAVLALASAAAVAQEVSPPVPVPPVPPAPTSGAIPLRVTLATAPEEEIRFITDAQSDVPAPSEYWIGIVLGELPEIAKQQLKVDGGIVVEDVLPDSPAAKAEFKRFDVLLRAADKPLAEPADIVKAVDESKDKELVIEAIRSGDRLKLRVVPVKRPLPEAGAAPADATTSPGERESALKLLEEALTKLKGTSGGETLGLYFPRPGVVATEVRQVELPKNLSITITRSGDEPAKIHVKRDNKEWDTTADKLNELPEDVRQQVEQLVGKTIHPTINQRVVLAPTIAAIPGVPVVPGVAAVPPRVTVTKPEAAGKLLRLRAVLTEPSDEKPDDKGPEAGNVAGKLDLILKKLDNLESKAIEQLQDEVKQLRKELDELRNK